MPPSSNIGILYCGMGSRIFYQSYLLSPHSLRYTPNTTQTPHSLIFRILFIKWSRLKTLSTTTSSANSLTAVRSSMKRYIAHPAPKSSCIALQVAPHPLTLALSLLLSPREKLNLIERKFIRTLAKLFDHYVISSVFKAGGDCIGSLFDG